METELRIGNKVTNIKNYRRVPYGWCCNKTKSIASKDISKECGEGKLYTKNYLVHERLILRLKEIPYKLIPYDISYNKYYELERIY